MTDTPYHEKFPTGTSVRIADLLILEEFHRTWKYHNKLEEQQLGYHDQIARVKQVGFYHGGDVSLRAAGHSGNLARMLPSASVTNAIMLLGTQRGARTRAGHVDILVDAWQGIPNRQGIDTSVDTARMSAGATYDR